MPREKKERGEIMPSIVATSAGAQTPLGHDMMGQTVLRIERYAETNSL